MTYGLQMCITSPDGEIDIIVYYARAQIFYWNEDGTPNFGIPVADGPISLQQKELVKE